MIVTAPYRSGGTSLALKMAKDHNLIFAGQLDTNSVPFTRLEDKNSVHEYQNQPDHSVNDLVKLLIDDTNHVILNNSHIGLFNRSTHFIIREDWTRMYSSFYWLMSKFYPKMNLWNVDMLFKRATFFNASLLSYLKTTGTVPLILEEQDWYTHKVEHDIPSEYMALIGKYTNYLKEFK